jgi:hypothetical protein
VEFKKGDKLLCTATSTSYFKIGEIYTLSCFNNDIVIQPEGIKIKDLDFKVVLGFATFVKTTSLLRALL